MMKILLLPMCVCLFAGFMFLIIYIQKRFTSRKMFYPKTMFTLKGKILDDKNGRYLYDRYSMWCSIAGDSGSPESYLFFSLLGAVGGFLIGLATGNMIVSFALFILVLLTPTLLLYARYIVRINKRISSFSHFVDIFSRHYNSRKNIILTFREMIHECPKELQSELVLLNNKLSDGGNPIQAVESFSERMNHHWAQDFATYIASGLAGETEDIQASLMRLTHEMFVQQDEKEERNSEIYAIWVSLLIVIIICVLLIPYNQTLLKESYRLYFFTPDGQALLSIASIVWCFSLLLAFIWGRRHG